jgi:hypothetical protein
LTTCSVHPPRGEKKTSQTDPAARVVRPWQPDRLTISAMQTLPVIIRLGVDAPGA